MDIANEKIAEYIANTAIKSGERPKTMQDQDYNIFLDSVLSISLLLNSDKLGVCKINDSCTGIGCFSLSHKLLFTYIKYKEEQYSRKEGFYISIFRYVLNELRKKCNYEDDKTPFNKNILEKDFHTLQTRLLKITGFITMNHLGTSANKVFSKFLSKLNAIDEEEKDRIEAENQNTLKQEFQDTFGNSTYFKNNFFTNLHTIFPEIVVDKAGDLEYFLKEYDKESFKKPSNDLTVLISKSKEYLVKFIKAFEIIGLKPENVKSSLSIQIIDLLNQYAAKEEQEAADKKAKEEQEAAEKKAKAEQESAEKKAKAEQEAAAKQAKEAAHIEAKNILEKNTANYLKTEFKIIDLEKLLEKIPSEKILSNNESGNNSSIFILSRLNEFVNKSDNDESATINDFVQKIKENNKSDKLTDASELTKINDEDLKKYWIEVTSDRPNEVEVVTLFKQEYYNFREYVLEKFYSIDDANKRKQLIDSFDSFVFLCHMLEFMHSNPTQGRKYIDIYKNLTFTTNQQIDEKNTTNAKKMFFHYLNRSLMADVSEGEQKLIKSACTQKF